LFLVVEVLQFRFVLFEQARGPSSYEPVTDGHVTGDPAQTVDVIKQAARSLAENQVTALDKVAHGLVGERSSEGSNPEWEICVYEVRHI